MDKRDMEEIEKEREMYRKSDEEVEKAMCEAERRYREMTKDGPFKHDYEYKYSFQRYPEYPEQEEIYSKDENIPEEFRDYSDY